MLTSVRLRSKFLAGPSFLHSFCGLSLQVSHFDFSSLVSKAAPIAMMTAADFSSDMKDGGDGLRSEQRRRFSLKWIDLVPQSCSAKVRFIIIVVALSLSLSLSLSFRSLRAPVFLGKQAILLLRIFSLALTHRLRVAMCRGPTCKLLHSRYMIVNIASLSSDEANKSEHYCKVLPLRCKFRPPALLLSWPTG